MIKIYKLHNSNDEILLIEYKKIRLKIKDFAQKDRIKEWLLSYYSVKACVLRLQNRSRTLKFGIAVALIWYNIEL